MSTILESVKFWLTENKKRIFWTAAVVLVFILGLGMGYLAGRGDNRTPIIIEKLSE